MEAISDAPPDAGIEAGGRNVLLRMKERGEE